MCLIFYIILELFLTATSTLTCALLLFPTALGKFVRVIIARLLGTASYGIHTVVIFQASTGIGEELSYEYASAGYNLVLLSMDKVNLDRVVETCRDLGSGSVRAVTVDLCDTKSITELVDAKAREWRLDLFIANIIVTVDERRKLNYQDGADELDVCRNYQTATAGINAIFQSLVRQHRSGQIAVSVSPEILQGNACPLNFLASYNVARTATLAYGMLMRSVGRRYGIRFNYIEPHDIVFAAIMESNFAKENIVWMTSQKQLTERILCGLSYDFPIIIPPFWSYTLSFYVRTYHQ